MTLVTDALSRIARQCSRDEPESWVTASELEHKEIRDDFLLETVDEVLRRGDYPSPIGASYDLTGDGSDAYDLPAAFVRLDRGELSVIETFGCRDALVPVSTAGEWEWIKDQGATGLDTFFHLSGYEGSYQINIFPALTKTITISYQTANWLRDADGTPGATFNDPDQHLLLPRLLVEAGTVARWRERKGLDASEKRREFEFLLGEFKATSRPIRSVNMKAPRARRPWDIPVPDTIPSS